MMSLTRDIILLSTILNVLFHPVTGFLQNEASFSSGRLNLPVPSSPSAIVEGQPNQRSKRINQRSTKHTHLFMAGLWERLQIEEDPEPMWYLLNCVAGLEIDLLRQCRQRCEGMEDAEKFVVPTKKETRSHGATRMVTETKVKYLGYVFAKLRLCQETYEAIQGLDLCRSWMGTVNHKGYKKLPPAPVALNELEVENFGLEDEEFEEEEEEMDENGIIVDDADEDAKEDQMEEDLKVYEGLRVEDMIKVTASGKFYNEDGIVRRLKNGQILIRFYTYGTMYEEWLDPKSVRKLNNIEILKGLSGPSQPITQREFDGPRPGERYQYGDNQRPSELRSNLWSNIKGGRGGGAGGPGRNRRQDRAANRFRDRGQTVGERLQEEKNWNWYKENQRQKKNPGYSDGEWEMRGSESNSRQPPRGRDHNWAQGDVDSQWGRAPKPRQRRKPPKRQNRLENQRVGDALDGEGDWSAFVSPASSPISKDETEEFFKSLMTDLSQDDIVDDNKSGGGSKSNNQRSNDIGSSNSDEDDFFASLVSEISEEDSKDTYSSSSSDDDDFFASLTPNTKGSKNKRKDSSPVIPDDDDFFSSLEAELGNDLMDDPIASSTSTGGGDDDDDFFASLAAGIEEIKEENSPEGKVSSKSKSSKDDHDDDDLFGIDVGADDFFADLESELISELGEDDTNAVEEKSQTTKLKQNVASSKSSAPSREEKSSSPSTNDPANLQKLTVPILKDMLRERGLKVSGKKAELIERLSQ